ncbi:MAG: FHA domain-containing protein [Thiotrichaceae bacterium]|nr:FHA domain-containing protein [Thiotrichaceae bacterium]
MIKFFNVLVLCLLTVQNVTAQDNIFDISTEVENDRLVVQYQLATPMQVGSIQAKINDVTLPLLTSEDYPTENATTAILFLVDISDPRRRKVVEQNREQIKTMLAASEPHQQFGLATFATDLKILAPLGTSVENIIEQVEQIQATGQTTELYKHSLTAIQTLTVYPAQRKALFIFSDGGAEDTAYTHEEVVTAAKQAQIRIYGLGFAMSTSASVQLQIIEKLSLETNGLYFKANRQYALPETFLQSPYELIDNGQKMIFDLIPAIEMGLTGQQNVVISWQIAIDSLQTTQTINIPEPIMTLPIYDEEITTEPSEIIAESNDTDVLKQWWLWILGVFLLLILLLRFVLRPLRPYAYLEGNQLRYPIKQTTVRIGRHGDNELSLGNTSVSNHHAELHRRRDGQFVIVDLDSLNGVYVNGKQTKTSLLANGDAIDIGEVKFLFIKK